FLDTGNLTRFMVSLALAFALWAWVTYENDPQVTRRIPAVQPTAVNVPPGLRVANSLPPVEIRLEGPQSELNTLEADRLRVEVDLKGIQGPGVYERPVRVRAPGHIQVKSVTPPRVQVQLEPASADRAPGDQRARTIVAVLAARAGPSQP
ncbi:MAG: YbbR-like domain-containing protein, partial [Thermomicrobiaceae bacterium]|nr:YbbR-like domain-containing protein [Thermomicrobiaceae bacterium]